MISPMISSMWKSVLAGTTALAILGSSAALAQQTPPTDMQRSRPTAEDFAALTDARVAGLKAGLKLTAEQEKHWPAVEAAIRDLAKQRAEGAAARRAQPAGDNARPPRDAIERLRRGSDAMTTRATALKHLADAAEPLYKSLDDGQKRRFGVLMRMGGPDGGGPRGHWQRRADNAR